MLVPGLAADFTGYAAGTLPAAPALSLWLRRAAASDFAATLNEQAIAVLCGITRSATAPVAAPTYLEDFGELPAGYCLRADPVHLRADASGLVLFDAASFELSHAESQALSSTLASHLAQDGWLLRLRHPQRWYLSGGEPQDLITLPLPAVRGSAVPAVAFTGGDACAWTTRLNEIQMLMHTHPVNQARAEAGRPAVNSLWLWGAGDLQQPASPVFTRVLGDDVFARGSARYCGLPGSPLPGGAEALTLSMAANDRLLVVLDDCRDAAAYQDMAAWQVAVQRLEHDWFAALLRSLKTGRLDSLELYPLNGSRYRLTRRQLLSFWKGRGDYRGHSGFRCAGASRV